MSFLYKWVWFEIDHGRQVDGPLMVYAIHAIPMGAWIESLMLSYKFIPDFIYFFTVDARIEFCSFARVARRGCG